MISLLRMLWPEQTTSGKEYRVAFQPQLHDDLTARDVRALAGVFKPARHITMFTDHSLAPARSLDQGRRPADAQQRNIL